MSYEEEQAGNQTTIVLAISALIVFLALAALYESWTIPFSVILMIPIGVLGAVLGTFILDLSNDIYFQVGLLATMGLSAKNAIWSWGYSPAPCFRCRCSQPACCRRCRILRYGNSNIAWYFLYSNILCRCGNRRWFILQENICS